MKNNFRFLAIALLGLSSLFIACEDPYEFESPYVCYNLNKVDSLWYKEGNDFILKNVDVTDTTYCTDLFVPRNSTNVDIYELRDTTFRLRVDRTFEVR